MPTHTKAQIDSLARRTLLRALIAQVFEISQYRGKVFSLRDLTPCERGAVWGNARSSADMLRTELATH